MFSGDGALMGLRLCPAQYFYKNKNNLETFS